VNPFTKLCLKYLQEQVCTSNVLDIVSTVASFTSLCSCKKAGRREDNLKAEAADENDDNEVTEMYEELAFVCLQTIDKNAEALLEGKDFLLLSPKMVQFIIKRDTLVIGSETLVINALNRWCVHRCGQKGMMATLKNKNKILQELKLHIRWLTLKPAELEMCQAQYGLLSPREFKTIHQALKHTNCTCPLPSRLQRHRKKMSLRRCGLHHFPTLRQNYEEDVKKPSNVKHRFDDVIYEFKKNHKHESIYESIDHQPESEIGDSRSSSFETSCLHLGNQDDYRLLNQSNECILETEDKSDYHSCNALVFCFSHLFD